MKSYKDATIVFLLAVVLMLSVLSFSDSKVSNGTPTNFDVSTTVSSLKALDANLEPEFLNLKVLHILMKHSAQLPDSIYADLLDEYYKRENSKCHYIRVKIYQYLELLQSNPNKKKIYKFTGGGASLQDTPKFIVFYGAKSVSLKITSTFTNNDDKIQIRLKQASGGVLSTEIVKKKENGTKEYTINFTHKWAGIGELYLDIDPPQGTTSWQMSITDLW